MSVKVLFFASLREQVGMSRAEVDVTEASTALSIWQQLTGKPALPSTVQVACNHAYCDPNTVIKSGDEVAFFPPMTGG